MKKIILTIIIGYLFGNVLYSQDNSQNLKKYWFYRERLKKFVFVSPNFDEAGTNIPAEKISEDKNTISWDDGNGAFNQYISVLATEYRLLKNFKQDYSQTIKELYYALKSFERLDKTAESIFRVPHSQLDGDLNGFFLRNDDKYGGFWDKYKKGGSNAYFDQVNSDPESDDRQNSLDNCIHYLEAFSLVKALVDDELVDGAIINFGQIAKDNALRIVSNMYHPNGSHPPVIDISFFDGWPIAEWITESILKYTWFLKNPVTGEFVPNAYGGGMDGTMCFASYGFAKAGNRMADEDRYSEMSYSYEITKEMLKQPVVADLRLGLCIEAKMHIIPPIPFGNMNLKTFSGNYSHDIMDIGYPVGIGSVDLGLSVCKSWDIGEDDYKPRSLCATGDIDIVEGKSPYEVLIDKQNQNPIFKYEHFPLIWSVITDNYAYIKDNDRQYIKSLLNVAPTCGPYKFAKNNIVEYGNYNWSSPSRLIWPERLGENSSLGYYNGLDYMLLHNLYWLTNFQYPQNKEFKQLDFLGGLFPLTAIAINQVICSSSVNTTLGNIKLIAGEEVILKPGFSVHTNNSHSFSARIANGMTHGEDPLFYQKASLEDCLACTNSLKSARISIPNEESKGRSSNFHGDSLMVYPNPCYDDITVKNYMRSEIVKIEIYNTIGNLEKKIEYIPSDPFIVDLSGLPMGIYFLKIYDSENYVGNFKIVKQ